MFKYRKPPKIPVLWLYDADGSVLYQDRLDAFPFPEEVVLAGCEEFFADDNPCEIHRRALQLRLCGEIEEMIPHNERISMNELPDILQLYCQEIHPASLMLETASETDIK